MRFFIFIIQGEEPSVARVTPLVSKKPLYTKKPTNPEKLFYTNQQKEKNKFLKNYIKKILFSDGRHIRDVLSSHIKFQLDPTTFTMFIFTCIYSCITIFGRRAY
jgi:hypothetical protein